MQLKSLPKHKKNGTNVRSFLGSLCSLILQSSMDTDIHISASSIGRTKTGFLLGTNGRATVVGNHQCIILIGKGRLKSCVDSYPDFSLLGDIQKSNSFHHLWRVLLLLLLLLLLPLIIVCRCYELLSDSYGNGVLVNLLGSPSS